MRSRPDSALGLLAWLDGRAARTVRVGVLVPWANVAVEGELPLLDLTRSAFHYARLVPASRTTAVDEAFLVGLRRAAGIAVDSLRHVPLDGTVMACTSAGFTAGPALPPGIISAFDALVGSLRALGARHIVLAAPYPDEVTYDEVVALEEAGLSVLAHISLGLDDGYPDIPVTQVEDLVHRLPTEAVHAADAVVLSCTGWHTLAYVRRLEQELGKPVVSSNLAMALHAARLSAGVIT
ncbi:hypothetical protein AB0J38_02180 [Streptomyces sp. NPDC050095]|uniref:maleate cis-trans isomerase family protein n=1 Tax=unclassified Streptomyces TaxID=2593676 RepID=UPI00342A9424